MEVTNYSQIIVPESSLVVFDIDETLIYFDNIDRMWWKKHFDIFYEESKDYDLADDCVLNLWTETIEHITPKAFDVDGLQKLIKQIEDANAHYVLCTARSPDLRELTFRQLKTCNIHHDAVYFSRQKGKVINEIHMGRHVVFVDDMQSNIDDVRSHDFASTCYLAKFKRTS